MNIDEVINGWTFEETIKTAESLMEAEKNMFKWDVIRHLRDFAETYREQLKEYHIDMPGSNISREASELVIQALETIKKLSDRKMTAEVLENYMQFEDECVKQGFTFKSLIEAREKQIPKKPVFTEDKEFALCPCCKGKGLLDKKKYCDNCGQRLDFEEV